MYVYWERHYLGSITCHLRNGPVQFCNTQKIEKAFCDVDIGEAYPTFVDNVIIELNANDESDSDTGSSSCEGTDSKGI